MIISKTPFRLSYAGGGTDFKDFYFKYAGSVVTVTIDKYLYVTVNDKFDGRVHLRYSQIEDVDSVDNLKHNLVREALKMFGIKRGIEIVTISDIPTAGSGLGSSSALAVGLINALYTKKNRETISTRELAEIACRLEIEILESPIGKQDQYGCAIGGLKNIIFKDDMVTVKKYNLASVYSKELESRSMLFYLGYTRTANNILIQHKESIDSKFNVLKQISDLSSNFSGWLDGYISIDVVDNINEGWNLKKRMAFGYTSQDIDCLVNKVRSISSRIGVKLCGAGGGGFMLVVSPVDMQGRVREMLKDLCELKFKFTEEGSQIIYVS